MNGGDEVRDRIVRLAFAGDEGRFTRFVDSLRAVTPRDAEVILRGSAVTGTRWADGQPFDADGPGTSDLDVTFIGGDLIKHWESQYIPGLHTVPLSDEHPDACPRFLPLRHELCRLAGRPVNLQATTSLVQFARDVLFDQPYYTLIEKESDNGRASSEDGEAFAGEQPERAPDDALP
jgi:hypothetical protein